MEPLGMDAPGGGLAINQLLKMKARGLISLADFLELTKDVEGFEEERPVEPDAAENAAEEEEGDDDGGEQQEEEQDDDEDEEESEAEEEPPAKKLKLDGTLLSFVTKHAPPLATIAKERTVPVAKYEPKKPVSAQANSQTGKGRGPSTKKQGTRANDVKGATLHGRPGEWPGHGLRVVSGDHQGCTCAGVLGQDPRILPRLRELLTKNQDQDLERCESRISLILTLAAYSLPRGEEGKTSG